FRVTFKKLDIASDCSKISNRTYQVTSDQMPLKKATSTDRYAIRGKGVSTKVVTPVVIKSVKSSPSSVIYGEEATLTMPCPKLLQPADQWCGAFVYRAIKCILYSTIGFTYTEYST
ncbi:MAG: hypothetical protein ACLFVO_20600, partial [Chloroflexaceae bacterium]